MVVAGFEDDVEEIVIGVYDRKPLIRHVHRVGPTIIPVVKNNISVYSDATLHPGQGTPHSHGFPLASQVSIIGINKPHILIRSAWGVLIRAYIYLLGIKPRQELVPDTIHEGVGRGVIQVKKLF